MNDDDLKEWAEFEAFVFGENQLGQGVNAYCCHQKAIATTKQGKSALRDVVNQTKLTLERERCILQ